jgi:ribonuclease HI
MPFYGVKKGNLPGIYTKWDDCNKAISGFSGALYKKFNTKDEAESFVNGTESPDLVSNDAEHDYFIYTDGSCVNNGKSDAQAGIGVYFGLNDPRNLSKRVIGKQTNNTAELSAISEVYNIVESDILTNKRIIICSDSQYAIRCVTSYGKKNSENNWSENIPNKELVKHVYDLYKQFPNVGFLYVPAHTGKTDRHSLGNDGADKLANSAIGLERCPYAKIYLNVPYSRKDEAKGLGAKWDAGKKKWYIFDNMGGSDVLKQMFHVD